MAHKKKIKLFFNSDVEGTGPNVTVHSMYQFASAPILADGTTFPGKAWDVALLSEDPEDHDSDTMKFLKDDQGITLESLIARPNQVTPLQAMKEFEVFVGESLRVAGADKAVFIADNLAYDWEYTNKYFQCTIGKNPFGHGGRNIPCLANGILGDRDSWEKFRITPHTHDALDDVTGNNEALAHMIKHHGLILN